MKDLQDMNNFELRDELIDRCRRLLKEQGDTEINEVGDPGSYEWRSEFSVGDVLIIDDCHSGLTVYLTGVYNPDIGYRPLAYDAYPDGVIRTWEPPFVIMALTTLRRHMVLEDLAAIE